VHFDEPHRQAASEGRLVLQRCPACATIPNFPRIACPGCLTELAWFEASGLGRVESFTVVRRTHHADYEPHVPIVMALVATDEGSELISTLVGDDRLDVEIGSRVRVAAGWSTLPQFELCPQEGESR
jgi:uncharacterized OB-fold protein